jgi:hypothetical protein
MLRKKHKRPLMMVLVALFAVTLACRVEAPRIVMEESPTPTSQPTLIITLVVTEIITPTRCRFYQLHPTQSNEPTLIPTFDPLAVPIYYPLPDCVASRLHKGDTAMVSYQGGDNAIRYSPDMSLSENIVQYASPGDQLIIRDGPYCSFGWLVWFVETLDGFLGYTPEGNGESYWLLPVQ